jgi:DNA transposition AAA+ family ATPase
MQTELKQKIATGAAEYAKQKKLSNNDVARATGVSAAYVSQIFNGKIENEVNGKPTPIGDTHFHKLAKWAGIKITKQYWRTLPTRQFVMGIAGLEKSKGNATTAMIIGGTGNSKTLLADSFCNRYPLHTYRVTVSSLYNLADIINELAELIGVDFNNGIKQSRKAKLDMLVEKLKNIKHNGGNPLIVFDEAENLKMPVINMLKGLYDLVNKYCGITLIGTPQLLIKLTNQRKNSLDALPQFYRRFKVGMIKLPGIEKHIDFTPFFNEFISHDKGLQKLLTNISDNYGDLNNYLEPALKTADERGEKLTEDFFRIMYNIPKY